MTVEFATCVVGNLVYGLGMYEGEKSSAGRVVKLMGLRCKDIVICNPGIYNASEKKWIEGPPIVTGRDPACTWRGGNVRRSAVVVETAESMQCTLTGAHIRFSMVALQSGLAMCVVLYINVEG